MIDQPQFASYSIPGRIFAGIAVCGGVSLGLLAFMGIYFVP